MEELAINGGPKTKIKSFGKGKRYGLEEANELMEALNQDTLFYHFGNKVKTFLSNFNDMYGVKYSVATSSGTAAIHVALGAAGVTVGDEVITSPITDMGSLIGILYQNAVPVFADLEPYTYNMDPKSIEDKITEKTKVILVVHLAGSPARMDKIMQLAEKYNLKVIEDCAQSYLTRYKGKLVGTIGDYGVFSTNEFKHISTGDGGIVTVNSRSVEDYQKTHMFADKNYNRFNNDIRDYIPYLAPNYRMTELQGAVGIAQLKKLNWICETRNKYGTLLTEGINDLEGIYTPQIPSDSYCTYWFYMFRVAEEDLGCTREEFSKALEAEGIPNQPGYLPSVVYKYNLFKNKEAYRGSRFPFDLSNVDYSEGSCQMAEEILTTSIKIPINEFYTKEDVNDIVKSIRKVANYYIIKPQIRKGIKC